MSDWESNGLITPAGTIAITDDCSLGPALMMCQATFGLAVVGTAKRIIFVPFTLDRPYVSKGGWTACGAGGSAGNFDVGVYDEFGNKLASTGSFAYASADNAISASWAATELAPGRYFMAQEADGTGPGIMRWDTSLSETWRINGCFEYSDVLTFPLPATMSFTSVSHSQMPFFGIYGKAGVM